MSTYSTPVGPVLPAPPPPPPPTPPTRILPGANARMVITDLYGRTTTWLQRQLLSGGFTIALNQPAMITADVRSADPAVNGVYPNDGFPLVAQSNRLVYVLLEESPSVWTCRATGILMSPEDEGDPDTSTTHITAYDAWQWLMGQPCFLDQVGTQIGQDPLIVIAPGNVIALTMLQNTLASVAYLGYSGPQGPPWTPSLIDLPAAYGGTAFYTGSASTATPTLSYTIQAGTTLGQLFTDLTSMGNDTPGTAQAIDIWMEPIYDPVNRPGYIAQISIFPLMGSAQPTAVFSWGRYTRSAVTADRQHDGTPGSFINVAQFAAGQAGNLNLAPINPASPPVPPSVATYYSYWSQQFFPSQPYALITQNLAVQALTLYKQGKRTFAVDPDPLRAVLPFQGYQIGDRVQVISTDEQRVGASGYQRVETIPVVINPNGVTSVSKLLTSPDWPQAPAALTGLSPTSGVSGTGATITATDFLPLTPLSVKVGNQAAAIISGVLTDGVGAATVTFTVPSLPTGNREVVVTDGINIAVSPTPFDVT